MKEEKGKNIINGTLIAIIVLLALALITLLTSKIELKSTKEQSEPTQTNEKISYTYQGVAGLYTKTEDTIADNEQLKETTSLLLNADGTYFYSYAVRVSRRHAGNYIIEDNKIILNKLFNITDGPGTTPSFETITLEINNDKTINYTNKETVDGKTKNVILEKASESEKENYIKKYGADKETILNNSYYTNKIPRTN